MRTGKSRFIVFSSCVVLVTWLEHITNTLWDVLFTNYTLPGCVLIRIFGGWT
jgi:hypothetical protein